jgi:hypothetical protein
MELLVNTSLLINVFIVAQGFGAWESEYLKFVSILVQNNERLIGFKKLMSKFNSTVKCDPFALCFMVIGRVLREEMPKQNHAS